jgi:hypothetical protein
MTTIDLRLGIQNSKKFKNNCFFVSVGFPVQGSSGFRFRVSVFYSTHSTTLKRMHEASFYTVTVTLPCSSLPLELNQSLFDSCLLKESLFVESCGKRKSEI